MWNKIAHLIIRYRIVLLLFIAMLTAVMGYHARLVHLTYSAPKVIPIDNPKYADYLKFKKQFGEDGNVMVIGIQTNDLFTTSIFNSWNRLATDIKTVPGVDEVITIGKIASFKKDTANKKLVMIPIFSEQVSSQATLDSLKEKFFSLPFYTGRIYNEETGATLMAIRINNVRLNSPARVETVNRIEEYGKQFSEISHIDLHYSGMPLIRTIMVTQIAGEMRLFLLLAIIVTGLVLLILLRSFYAVFFSLLVVAIAVIWTMGTIEWMGYEITILTGLLPPLVVVISITNCMYLLNKYHIEFLKYGNKIQALKRVIARIGLATLFTNLTAAIGFGVFYFTRSTILKEFGLVAGLNIAAIFFISIILIPCVFSFLPPPKTKHTGYLDHKFLNKIMRTLENLVQYRRKWIFSITLILVVIALIGCFRLQTTGYIVDDLPHDNKVYTDLKFFEANFHGVMPMEILVDTKKKGGVLTPARLNKISQFEDSLKTFPEFSQPLSIADGIKFVRQAYYEGGPEEYRLPNDLERSFIFSYLGNTRDSSHIISSFVDSSRQVARISMSMKDIGTNKMEDLVKSLTPKIYSVFDTSKYKITITGSSVIFLEGNQYIIEGLTHSLLLALLLIAICMGYLFRSLRMVFFSVLPNLIPLVITAGIMGYFNIPLKPSTVLIFSIAFGIAIDNAIRFLAKYQQELQRHNWDIKKTVSMALYESGISIIYTSIILFFGFIIFTLSDFGGTFYLGLLTSITLVVAMFNNLLVLPSLMLTMKKYVDRRALKAATPANEIDLLEENEQTHARLLLDDKHGELKT